MTVPAPSMGLSQRQIRSWVKATLQGVPRWPHYGSRACESPCNSSLCDRVATGTNWPPRVATRRPRPMHTYGLMATAEFTTYLKARCADRGLSLHKLAVRADLNQIYFYQSVNKNKDNPPPWVLRRIAPLLEVPYVELLMRAGYLTTAELAEYNPRSPPPSRPRPRIPPLLPPPRYARL